MKIFNLLQSKAGKMALSTMQAVGLSAAVGVVGVAAWQMMGSSAEVNPDTAFSAADNDVVFVAGVPGGSDYGAGYGAPAGGYGAGGAVRSGINTRMSHDMRLMQEDQLRMKASSQEGGTVSDRQVASVERYEMTGRSAGLGLGKNAAAEVGGAMNGSGVDLNAIQQQLAQLQASAQQQAEAGNVQAAAAAALQKPGGAGAGRYGMNGAMARASGNNLNATPLQAGARPNGAPSRAGGVLGGAQPGAQRTAGAGRNALFQGGRDASFGAARGFTSDGNTLAGLSSQSKQVAQSAGRSANAGSQIFLASEKVSGGVYIDGENINTGSAASSDFGGLNHQLGGLGAGIGGVLEMVTTFEEDREELRLKLQDFYKKCERYSHFASWAPIAWIIGKLERSASKKRLESKIQAFEAKWGESSYETGSSIGGYAQTVRDAADKMFHSLHKWGGPKAIAKDYGRKYWDNDKAFTDKEVPASPDKKGEVRGSPFSGGYSEGGLRTEDRGRR